MTTEEVATAQLPPSVESTSDGEGGETMCLPALVGGCT